MKPKTKTTLALLRLHRPNHCVVVENTPSLQGMLKIVKDYVAYGPLKSETHTALLAKRGEGATAEDSPVYRLHPPRKGHRDIKEGYPRGALGARPEMDRLLKRMM